MNEIEIGDIFKYHFYYYAPRFKLNKKIGIILKEMEKFKNVETRIFKTYCFNTNTIEIIIEENLKKG